MKRTINIKATMLFSAVALALTGSLSACSASGDSDTVTVGYSTWNLTNPYFAGILKGLENQTDELGWKLVVTNSNASVDGQVADIENMITRGVDFIMLTPIDAQAVTPAINAAKSAGVDVFALGDTVKAPIAQQVLPDSVKAAELAVDQIAANLTARYGEPRGTVINVRGKVGTVVAEDREKGFREGLAKYPGITVVADADGGFDTAQANSVMTDMLQANPRVDAVWAANDAMAVGVSSAINSSGRFRSIGDPDRIFVIGMDGAKPAIDDIRRGVQDATISQNPIAMAALAVKNAQVLRDGGSVENLVNFPLQLITVDNIDSEEVAQYGIWGDLVE